jgi:hypothetical protein
MQTPALVFLPKRLSVLPKPFMKKKNACLIPRTEARVLGTQNISLVKKIIDNLSRSYPEPFRKHHSGAYQ